MRVLSGWQTFYEIVGSSAGALIGLQFILISLIGRQPHGPEGAQTSRAFSTPTVVHFTIVLLLAGAGTAPWPQTGSLAVLWCAFGVAGLIYAVSTVRRLSRQTLYVPETEDWLFHGVLPIIAYATLAASALYERSDLEQALFVVAGVILLLLVIGIHNAWDAASYHVFEVRSGIAPGKDQSSFSNKT